MGDYRAVQLAAEAISDLLTMLGVDPDERPEGSAETIGQTLARVVIDAARPVIEESGRERVAELEAGLQEIVRRDGLVDAADCREIARATLAVGGS